MRMRLLLLLVLPACGRAERAPEAPPRRPDEARVPDAPRAPDATPPAAATCLPAELAGARSLERAPVRGCVPASDAPLDRPLVLADAAAVAASLACADGAAPALAPGDGALVVGTFRPSPAFASLAAYDDGVTVTFLRRDRSPCPDDPRPMPGPDELVAFRLPPGAARAFEVTWCSLPPACQ